MQKTIEKEIAEEIAFKEELLKSNFSTLKSYSKNRLKELGYSEEEIKSILQNG